MTTLYIGTRKGLDKWMYDNDINPAEHGASIKWANNGPNTLRLSDAPIAIVEPEDWYERTIWDEMAVQTAGHLNAIEEHQRRKTVKT